MPRDEVRAALISVAVKNAPQGERVWIEDVYQKHRLRRARRRAQAGRWHGRGVAHSATDGDRQRGSLGARLPRCARDANLRQWRGRAARVQGRGSPPQPARRPASVTVVEPVARKGIDRGWPRRLAILYLVPRASSTGPISAAASKASYSVRERRLEHHPIARNCRLGRIAVGSCSSCELVAEGLFVPSKIQLDPHRAWSDGFSQPRVLLVDAGCPSRSCPAARGRLHVVDVMWPWFLFQAPA